MSRLEGLVFGIYRKIHSLNVREMVNKKNPLLNLPFLYRIHQNHPESKQMKTLDTESMIEKLGEG